LKASIFIFVPGVLAAGSVVAQENGTSLSPRFAMAETSFNLDYGNNQIVDRADDDSARYSVWRTKIATGVSRSLSRWNFDSNG